MSLFVGNISSKLSLSDIERAFSEFGKCTVNLKVNI